MKTETSVSEVTVKAITVPADKAAKAAKANPWDAIRKTVEDANSQVRRFMLSLPPSGNRDEIIRLADKGETIKITSAMETGLSKLAPEVGKKLKAAIRVRNAAVVLTQSAGVRLFK